MERKECELVASKQIQSMKEAYDQGSRSLTPLCIGDHVRVQNQTTTQMTKWDKTGIITAVLGEHKYEIMMDGSRCLTTRNRRHLRQHIQYVSRPNVSKLNISILNLSTY